MFGAFLLLTGIKMLVGRRPAAGPGATTRCCAGSPAHLPLTRGYHGEALWIGEGAARSYTPLFVVLVMIGVTDVIFAVDSIPAIFAITDRSVHRADLERVRGARPARAVLPAGRAWPTASTCCAYGLALVLVFIGAKMLLVDVVQDPGAGVAGRGRGAASARSMLPACGCPAARRADRPARPGLDRPRGGPIFDRGWTDAAIPPTHDPELAAAPAVRARFQRALIASMLRSSCCGAIFLAQQWLGWTCVAVALRAAGRGRACWAC